IVDCELTSGAQSQERPQEQGTGSQRRGVEDGAPGPSQPWWQTRSILSAGLGRKGWFRRRFGSVHPCHRSVVVLLLLPWSKIRLEPFLILLRRCGLAGASS